jgi:acetolactate synthase regulatory subunit
MSDRRAERRFQATLELIVVGGPDAIQRVVRVASSAPFDIIRMSVAPVRESRRRVRLTVTGDSADAEILRKRLDRVVDVSKVRLIDGVHDRRPVVHAAPRRAERMYVAL